MFNSEQLEQMRTAMIKSDLILLVVGNNFVKSIKDPRDPQHIVDVTQFEIAKKKEHVAILWVEISPENEEYFLKQLAPVKPFYECRLEAGEPMRSQVQDIRKAYEELVGGKAVFKVQTRGDYSITEEKSGGRG